MEGPNDKSKNERNNISSSSGTERARQPAGPSRTQSDPQPQPQRSPNVTRRPSFLPRLCKTRPRSEPILPEHQAGSHIEEISPNLPAPDRPAAAVKKRSSLVKFFSGLGIMNRGESRGIRGHQANQPVAVEDAPRAQYQVIHIDSDDDEDDDLVEAERDHNPFKLRRVQNDRANPVVLSTPSPQPEEPLHLFGDASPNQGHPVPAVGINFVGDYLFDDDLDDDVLAQVIGNQTGFTSNVQRHGGESSRSQQIERRPTVPREETLSDCMSRLADLFPGICRDHVSGLYNSVSKQSDRLIAYVLDKTEKGTPYPTTSEKIKALKRKRELTEDEEATKKYGATDRVIPQAGGKDGVRSLIRNLLGHEFCDLPMNFIDASLAQSGYRLFSTYRVLEEASRTDEPNLKLKRPRNRGANTEQYIKAGASNEKDEERIEILNELAAARRLRSKADQERAEKLHQESLEEANVRKAELEGTITECGCCYGDVPLNRMVHCDSEIMHWFCRACALLNAQTEIGNSKYELRCMSVDGCSSGFSKEQRSQFLDDKTNIALERNEQEAVLRLAGIENLASCPFCPYAAEYPPVEVNKEFHCKAPDCEMVSCRICKLESHIPKSCEEQAKDNGLCIRRQIEEAMSAAMIRKCNKCGTPFVKEQGCNKMTCTRNGCRNVQCYVCSKSCGYDHFNDPSRGGQTGNCPLFESVEDRHDNEVKEAEKAALEKVRAEHPEYTEEDLKVKMSDNVLKDDAQRKARDPRVIALPPGIRGANRFGGVIPELEHYHYLVAPGLRAGFNDPALAPGILQGLENNGFVDVPADENDWLDMGAFDDHPGVMLPGRQAGNHQFHVLPYHADLARANAAVPAAPAALPPNLPRHTQPLLRQLRDDQQLQAQERMRVHTLRMAAEEQRRIQNPQQVALDQQRRQIPGGPPPLAAGLEERVRLIQERLRAVQRLHPGAPELADHLEDRIHDMQGGIRALQQQRQRSPPPAIGAQQPAAIPAFQIAQEQQAQARQQARLHQEQRLLAQNQLRQQQLQQRELHLQRVARSAEERARRRNAKK